MMKFMDMLQNAWNQNRSLLCVGLDPDLSKINSHYRQSATPVYDLNRAIVDATADLVCAYKPQIAYYSGQGLEDQLLKTIEYIRQLKKNIPVILDAKRGDIGDTAEMYAREAFDHYGADAVTVNPYMGGETLNPFLKRADKGVIVLCKTSNPGSGDFQDLLIGGELLYEKVARQAATEWNQNNNVGLVVGATHPEALRRVREKAGDLPLLVPGIGAQGGDLAAVLKAGLNSQRRGLIINSSRAIIYASGRATFSESVRAAALDVVEAMRSSL